MLYGKLSSFGVARPNFSSEGFLGLYINDVKIDIVSYPYALLRPILEIDGIRLLQPEDIIPMKLSAITRRGSKKDFWDLYFLLQKFTVKELLELYDLKFGDGGSFMVVKSMTYFEDAEKLPDPQKIIDADWEEIKNYIINAVKSSMS